MNTTKALVYSLGVAIISVVLISVSKGAIPPTDWTIKNGLIFFVVAFFVLRVMYKKQDGSE